MGGRHALYFIVLLALLVSISMVLYVRHYTFKQQMIIVPSSERSSLLQPPKNLEQRNNERVKDVTIEDTKRKPLPEETIGDFNVQKLETKKTNHKVHIIDGFYDEHIEPSLTKDATRGLILKNGNSDEQDNSKKTVQCRNTIQGPEYITDSRGFICSVMQVDPKTQCCRDDIEPAQSKKDGLPPVERYSCATCNAKNQCCSSYEHCVSCCMDIDKRDQLKKMYQERKEEKLFQGVKTVFEVCLLRCRVGSRSVQNENRFKDPIFKYCYGSVN